MPELGTYGSVRGALNNGRPYRDSQANSPKAILRCLRFGNDARSEEDADEDACYPGGHRLFIRILAPAGAAGHAGTAMNEGRGVRQIAGERRA